MEEVLPSELWSIIVQYCSPLTLFFLEGVSSELRAYTADLFPTIRAQQRVPDVSSYAELVYYCTLKIEEKVKFCVERNWMQSLNLIECSGWETSWDLLQAAPIQYKILYPEMMKCNECRYEDSYKALNEVERALLLVRLTYDTYTRVGDYIAEKSKLPLPIIRKRIEQRRASEEEASIYWVFTGESVGQRPAAVNRRKWQECRDFITTNGSSKPPRSDHLFYNVMYFHASAEFLVKNGTFTWNSIATEIVLARRVFTQDQFFSCITGGGWDRYFSSRGMESSYRRFTRNHKVRPTFFLRSDNLAAFFRSSKKERSEYASSDSGRVTGKERWPKNLDKDSEVYAFFTQRHICK